MIIGHIIAGLEDGGAEAVLYRLCSSDATQSYCVVSMMDAGKYGSLLEEASVRVVSLNMPRGRLTPRGLWHLWRLLRCVKPDLVQTWMYHADLIGGVVARLAGVRRVFWGIRHSTLEPGKSRRSTIAIARLNAWLSHVVPERIVCCAEGAREVHSALGYAPDKLVVIPNGYDLGRFLPNPAAGVQLRAEWRIDADTPVLGMVGRFNPQKDHENLLCALWRLKRSGNPFRCVLVGRGLESSNPQLAGWLEKYELQSEVILLGQRSDVPAVMNAIDLHVLSSAFGEAFPNVLAEAMACGTPCVTTDVGDAAVIVGGTGWVVPPSDSDQLAMTLETALTARSDALAWHARCTAARERVEQNFSLEKMISAYHAVWGCEHAIR